MMQGSPLPSRRLRHLLRLPLLALALAAVLVDDAFRALVVPAVRALARLGLIRRIEGRIAALPPTAILLLFLIPLAIIEPFKIYALYLIGQGRFVAAAMTFVVAKVVGLGLAERLFSIGRDKLLSIRWFAWCHGRILAIRDGVHAWLERRQAWRQALRLLGAVRERLAALRLRLGHILRRGTGGWLAEARRRLHRQGAA
jgi:hypothetical protein